MKRTRKITMTAMLSAIATILMFIDFSVPFMPSFIKMDVSELPALIASFAMGPVSGVVVCFIKNLINFLMRTSTGGAGELANFLMGITFVVPAGLIYKKHRNLKGALWGSLIGALVMAAVSLPLNYYITYPIYAKLMPIDAIIGAYQAIWGGVDGLFMCLLVFNVPFTFLKGILDVILTFIIYKRISSFIHGR